MAFDDKNIENIQQQMQEMQDNINQIFLQQKTMETVTGYSSSQAKSLFKGDVDYSLAPKGDATTIGSIKAKYEEAKKVEALNNQYKRTVDFTGHVGKNAKGDTILKNTAVVDYETVGGQGTDKFAATQLAMRYTDNSGNEKAFNRFMALPSSTIDFLMDIVDRAGKDAKGLKTLSEAEKAQLLWMRDFRAGTDASGNMTISAFHEDQKGNTTITKEDIENITKNIQMFSEKNLTKEGRSATYNNLVSSKVAAEDMLKALFGRSTNLTPKDLSKIMFMSHNGANFDNNLLYKQIAQVIGTDKSFQLKYLDTLTGARHAYSRGKDTTTGKYVYGHTASEMEDFAGISSDMQKTFLTENSGSLVKEVASRMMQGNMRGIVHTAIGDVIGEMGFSKPLVTKLMGMVDAEGNNKVTTSALELGQVYKAQRSYTRANEKEAMFDKDGNAQITEGAQDYLKHNNRIISKGRGYIPSDIKQVGVNEYSLKLTNADYGTESYITGNSPDEILDKVSGFLDLKNGMSQKDYANSGNSMAVAIKQLFTDSNFFKKFMQEGEKTKVSSAARKGAIQLLSQKGMQDNIVLKEIFQGLESSGLTDGQANLLLQRLGMQVGMLQGFDYSATDILKHIRLQNGRNDFNSMKTRFRALATSLEEMIGKENATTLREATNQLSYSRGDSGLYGLAEIFSSTILNSTGLKSFVPDTTGGNKDIEVIKKQIAETVATYKNHYTNDAVGSLLTNAKEGGLLAKGLMGTALKTRLDKIGIKSKATREADGLGIKEGTLGDDLKNLEAVAKKAGANISFVPSKDERSLELRISAGADLGSGNYASISIPIADAEGRILHNGVEKSDTLRFVTTTKNGILGFDVVSTAQQMVQNITRSISQTQTKNGRPTFMDNLNAGDYGSANSFLKWIEGLSFDSAASLQASATLRDLQDDAIAGMNKKELWAKQSRVDFTEGLNWLIESQNLDNIAAPEDYLSETFSVDDVRNTLMNYIMQETQGLGDSWLRENKNDPILRALQKKKLIGTGTNSSSFALTNFIRANLPQGTLEPQQEARFGAKNQINFGGARDYTSGIDLMSETKRAATQVQHTLKKVNQDLDPSRRQVLVSGHKNAINDYLNTSETAQYNILGITDELINATIESEAKAIEEARKAGTLEQTFGKNYQAYMDEIARYQQFAPSVHESGVLVTEEAMKTVDSYRHEKKRIEDDLINDKNFQNFLKNAGITVDELRALEDGKSLNLSDKAINDGLLWGKKNSRRNFIKNNGDVLNAIVRSEGKLYLDFNRFLGGNVGQKLLFDLTGWRTTANAIVSEQFMNAIGKKAGFEGRKIDVATQLDTMSKTSITDAIAQYNYIFDEYLKKDGANIETLQAVMNEINPALSRYFTPIQTEDGTITIQSFAERTRDKNRILMGKDKDGKLTTLFEKEQEAVDFLGSNIDSLAHKLLGKDYGPNAKGYDGGTYAMYRSGMGTANVYQWRRANGFDTYGNTREYGSLKVDPKSRYTVQRRISMAKNGVDDKSLDAYGKAWEAFGSQEDDSAFQRLKAEAEHMQEALKLTSGAIDPANPNEVYELQMDTIMNELAPDMGQRDGAHGHGYSKEAYNDTAYGALLKRLGRKYKYIKIKTDNALHFPVSEYSTDSFSSSSFYIPLMSAQMNNGEIDPRNFERGFTNVIKQFQNGGEADIQRALSGMLSSMGNDILNKEGSMNQLLNKKVAMNAMSGVAKGLNIANEREALEGGSALDYKDVIISTERMREMLTISDDLWKEGTSKKGKKESKRLLQTAKDNLAYTYRNLQEQLGIKDIEDFGEITAENQSEIIQKILDMTDISKVGADGKLGRIAGTLLRWPLVNSMGQPIINLINDSRLGNTNTITMNSGIAKLINGDFDDDTLYAAFSLMSNKYGSYDEFKQAMTGHNILANMQEVQTRILAHQMQADDAQQRVEAVGKAIDENGQTIKDKKIKNTADYLYNGGKQDSMETMLVKRNFSAVGALSNLNTSIRETLDEIGMGANGTDIKDTVAGEVINAFNEFFEQDVISAKKIAGRLNEMYDSGEVVDTQKILENVMNVYHTFSNSKYKNTKEGAEQLAHWEDVIQTMAQSGLLGKYEGKIDAMRFSGKQLDRAMSMLEAKGLSENDINTALGLTENDSYRQVVGEGNTEHIEYSIPLSAIPKLFAMADAKLVSMNSNLMLYRYNHLPFGTQYDENNIGALMRNAVSREILKADYTAQNGLLNYETVHYNGATKDDKPGGGHVYYGKDAKGNKITSDFSITEAGNLLFGKSEDYFYKDIKPQRRGEIDTIWDRASLEKGERLSDQFVEEFGGYLSDQSFKEDAQLYLKTKYYASTRGTAIHNIFEQLEKSKFFDNKELYDNTGKLNIEKFTEELVKTSGFKDLEKSYNDLNANMSKMSLNNLFGDIDIQDAKDIATLYAQNRGQMKQKGNLALLEEFSTLMRVGAGKNGVTLGGTADGITLKGITDYKIKQGGGRAIGLLESWQLNALWRNKVAQMQSDLEQANIHRATDIDANGDWFKQIEQLTENNKGSQLLSALKENGLMNEYQQMLTSYLNGEAPELTIQQFVKGKKGGWNLLTHYFNVMDDETFNALGKVLGDAKKQFNNKDWWVKQQVEALEKFSTFNTKRLGASKGVNLEGKAVNPYDVDDALYNIENVAEFMQYYKGLKTGERGRLVKLEKVMNMFGLRHETNNEQLQPIHQAFRKYLDKEMDITKLTPDERTLLSSYLMEGIEDIFNVERMTELAVQEQANNIYNDETVFSQNNINRYLWNKSYKAINKSSQPSSTTQAKDDFREEIFLANQLGENILKPTKTGYELLYGEDQKIQITTDKDKVNLKELVNKLDDKGVQEALKGVTSILHTHKDSFMPSIEDLYTFGKMAEKLKTLSKAQIYDTTNALLSTIDLNQFRDEETGEWISAKWEKYIERLNSLRDNPEKAVEEGLLKQDTSEDINATMSTVARTEEIPLKYHNIANALANLGKSDIADIYKLTAEEMLTNPELVQFGDYIEKYDNGLEKSYKDLQSNETKIKEADKQLAETQTKIDEAKKKGYGVSTAQKRIDELNNILSRFSEGALKGTKSEVKAINRVLSSAGMGDQLYNIKNYNKEDAQSWLQEKISNNNVSNAISSTISNLENSVALNNQYTTQSEELTKLQDNQASDINKFNKRLNEAQKANKYANVRNQAVQAMKKAMDYSSGKDMTAEAKKAYEDLYGKGKESDLRKKLVSAASDAGVNLDDKLLMKELRADAKQENRADKTNANKLLQETTSQVSTLQRMMAQNVPTQFLNSMTAGLQENLALLGGTEKGIQKVVDAMSTEQKVQMFQNIDQQFQGSMAQLRNIQLAKANAEAQLTDERRVLFGDNKGTYRTPKEYIINPYMNKVMSMKLNQLSTEEAKIQADVAQQMQSVKGTPMEQQMLEQQKFNQQIVETNKQMQETQRYATQGANGLQRFGQSFKGMLNSAFQYGVVYRGAQAVIQQIYTIIGAVQQFDTMSTQIRMIDNASKDTATDMIKGYRDVANELGTLTAKVTQAGITFLRQGRSIADTNQLIKDSTILAKVGMMEEAQSAELLTATLNGFQLEAKDAADVVDLVSYTDTIAATSTQELMTAFQYVASSANNAGIDIEHLNSMITTTSEATRLTASTIGQAFKTIVSRIQQVKAGSLTDAESGEDISNVDKVLKQHGIEVYSSTGGLATGQDILASVGENWKTMSKAQQREVTEALGGTRQGNIVMSLMENWDRNQEILADTEANASGSASKKQEIYNESIEASVARLQNALQDIFSEEGWAKDTYKWVIDLITAFADFGEVIIPLVTLFLLLKNGATGLNTVYNMQIGLYNKLTGTLKSLTNAEEYRLAQAQKGLVNGNVSTVSGGGLSAIKDPVTGTIGDPMESAKVAQTVAFQNTENLKKQMIAGGLHKYDNVYGEGAQSTWQRWQEAELGLQKAAVSQSGVSSSAVQKVENLVGEQVVANKISAEQGSQIMAGASAIAQRGVNTDAFNRIFNESFTTSDGQLITDKNFDYAGKTAELQKETSKILKDHPEMKPKVEQSTDAFVSLNTVIKQVIESLNIFNAKLNNKEYVPTTNSEGQPEVKKMSKDVGSELKNVQNEKARLSKEITQDNRIVENKAIKQRNQQIQEELDKNNARLKELGVVEGKTKSSKKIAEDKALRERNQQIQEELDKNNHKKIENQKSLEQDKDFKDKTKKRKELAQQERQLKEDLETKKKNQDYLSDDDKDLERFKFEDAKNKAKVTAQSELDRANQEVKQARDKFNDLKAQEKLGDLPKNSKELTQANEGLIKSLDKQRVAQENLNKVTQAETQSELDNASANLRDAETELQNANANQQGAWGKIGATGFGSNNIILQAAKNGSVKAQAMVAGAGMLGFMGTSMGATGLLQKAGVNDSVASLGGMVGGSVVSTISAANPLLGAGLGIAFAGVNAILDYQAKKADEIRKAFEESAEAVNTLSKDLREIKDKEFQSEFEKLSKGVDENGQNVSLSDKEYQTYQDFVSKLTEGREQLIEGYDAEGNALINRNNIMSEALKLMEEEIRLKREEAYVDKEKIETRLTDVSTEFDKFKKRATTKLNDDERIQYNKATQTYTYVGGDLAVPKEAAKIKEQLLDKAKTEMKEQGIDVSSIYQARNPHKPNEEQSKALAILEKYGLTATYNNGDNRTIEKGFSGIVLNNNARNAMTLLPEYASKIAQHEQAIQREKTQALAQYQSIYQQYASALNGYENLTTEQQKAVSTYIKGLDIANIDKQEDIQDSIENFVANMNEDFGLALTHYVEGKENLIGVDRENIRKQLINQAQNSATNEDEARAVASMLRSLGVVDNSYDVVINDKGEYEFTSSEYSKAQSELFKKIDSDSSLNSEDKAKLKKQVSDNLTDEAIKQMHQNYDNMVWKTSQGLVDLEQALEKFTERVEKTTDVIDNSLVKTVTESISNIIEASKQYYNEAKKGIDGVYRLVVTPALMEQITAFGQDFDLSAKELKSAFVENGVWQLGEKNIQEAIKLALEKKFEGSTLNLETLNQLSSNLDALGVNGRELILEEFFKMQYSKKNVKINENSENGFSYENLYGYNETMIKEAIEVVANKKDVKTFLDSIMPSDDDIAKGILEIQKGVNAVTDTELKNFKSSIKEVTDNLGGLNSAIKTLINNDAFSTDNLSGLEQVITKGGDLGAKNWLNNVTDNQFLDMPEEYVKSFLLKGLQIYYSQLKNEQENGQSVKVEALSDLMQEKDYNKYKADQAVKDLKAQMRIDDMQLDKVQAGFDKIAKSIEHINEALNNLNTNDFVGKFNLMNKQLTYSNEYMLKLNNSTAELQEKYASAQTGAEMTAYYEQIAKNEEAYLSQLQQQLEIKKQINSLVVEAFDNNIANIDKTVQRELSILQMQRDSVHPEKRNYYNTDALVSSALMMPKATKNNIEKARTEAERILKIQQDVEQRLFEYKQQLSDKIAQENRDKNSKELVQLQKEANKLGAEYDALVETIGGTTHEKIQEYLNEEIQHVEKLMGLIEQFKNNGVNSGSGHNTNGIWFDEKTNKYHLTTKGTETVLGKSGERHNRDQAIEGFNKVIDNSISEIKNNPEKYKDIYLFDENNQLQNEDAIRTQMRNDILQGSSWVNSMVGFDESRFLKVDPKMISTSYNMRRVPAIGLYDPQTNLLKGTLQKVEDDSAGKYAIWLDNYNKEHKMLLTDEILTSQYLWYQNVEPNADATVHKQISDGPIIVAEEHPEYVHFKNGKGAIFNKPTQLNGAEVDYITSAQDASKGKANGDVVSPYANGGNETYLSSSTNTQVTSKEAKEKVEENNESIVVNVEETNKDIFDKTKKHNEDIITDVEDTNKKVYDNTKKSNSDTYKNVNDTNYAIKSNTKKSLDETLVLFGEFFDGIKEIVPNVFDIGNPSVGVNNNGDLTQYAAIAKMVAPDYTRISSGYGNRTHPVYGTTKFHSGIDLPSAAGTPIQAYASGIVQSVKDSGSSGYGKHVIIDHGDGYVTLYGHASEILVKEGDKVSKGQKIALVGTTGTSTGNHLHFETRKDGSSVNPNTLYSLYDKGVGESNKRDLSSLGIMSEKQGEYKVDKETGEWIYEPDETIVDTDKYDVINSKDSQAIRNRTYDEGTISIESENYIPEDSVLFIKGEPTELMKTLAKEVVTLYNKYKKEGYKDYTNLSNFEAWWSAIYEVNASNNITGDLAGVAQKYYADYKKTLNNSSSVFPDKLNTETWEEYFKKFESIPTFISDNFRSYLETETTIRNKEKDIINTAFAMGGTNDVATTTQTFEKRQLDVLDSIKIERSQQEIAEWETQLVNMTAYWNEHQEELLADSEMFENWNQSYQTIQDNIAQTNKDMQEIISNKAQRIVDDVEYAMSQINSTQIKISKAMEDVSNTMNKLGESQSYQRTKLGAEDFALAMEKYNNANAQAVSQSNKIKDLKEEAYQTLVGTGYNDINGELRTLLFDNYENADFTTNLEAKEKLNSILNSWDAIGNYTVQAKEIIEPIREALDTLNTNNSNIQKAREDADVERYTKLWSLVDMGTKYLEEQKTERYSIYNAIIENNKWIKELVQLQGQLLKDTNTLGKSSNMVTQYNQILDIIKANQTKYDETLIDIEEVQSELYKVEGYNSNKWFDARGNIIATNYNQAKNEIEQDLAKAIKNDDQDSIAELTTILSTMNTLEGLYQDSSQSLMNIGDSLEQAISYQKEILSYGKELLTTFNEELVSEFKKNTEANEMSISFLSKIENTLGVFNRDQKIVAVNSQLRINSNERQNLLSQRNATQWSTDNLRQQINDITNAIDVDSLFTATGEQMVANYNEAQKTLDEMKETGEISDGQYNSIKNNIDQIGENLKSEVSLNNDIVSTYEKENELLDKKIDLEKESYDWQITKMQSLLELKEKQFEIENKIFDIRHDLDKELRSAKQSMQWLTKSERLKIFNEEDYTKLYQSIDKMEQQSQVYYDDYYNQIMNLTEETLYQQEYITAEYQRRMELVEAEYNLTEKRVDLEKQQLKLKNTLAEKNTRMYINGEWVHVANTDNVISESEALADAEAELQKAEQERLQKLENHRMTEYIDNLKEIQASLENSKNSTNETEQQLINELAKLTGAIVGGDLNTDSLATLIDSLNMSVYNFTQETDKLVNEELLQSIEELKTIFDGLENFIQTYNSVLQDDIQETEKQLSSLHKQADKSYETFFEIIKQFGQTIIETLEKIEKQNYQSYDNMVYDSINETVVDKKAYSTYEQIGDFSSANHHSQNANDTREYLYNNGETYLANFLRLANADEVTQLQNVYKEVGPEGVRDAIDEIIAQSGYSLENRAQNAINADIAEILRLQATYETTNDETTKKWAEENAQALRKEIGRLLGVSGTSKNTINAILESVNKDFVGLYSDYKHLLKNEEQTELLNKYKDFQTKQIETETLLTTDQQNAVANFADSVVLDMQNTVQDTVNTASQGYNMNKFAVKVDDFGKISIVNTATGEVMSEAGKLMETASKTLEVELEKMPDDLREAIVDAINEGLKNINDDKNDRVTNPYSSSISISPVYKPTNNTNSQPWQITPSYSSSSPFGSIAKAANGGITNKLLELTNIDEIGKELYIPSGRLKMMEYGDQVIPHNLSENLLKWGALNPAILQASNPEVTTVTNKKELNVKIDNVNLENVTNGENFMPELNRYLRRTTTLDK